MFSGRSAKRNLERQALGTPGGVCFGQRCNDKGACTRLTELVVIAGSASRPTIKVACTSTASPAARDHNHGFG